MIDGIIFVAALSFLAFFIWYAAEQPGGRRRWIGVALCGLFLLIALVSLIPTQPRAEGGVPGTINWPVNLNWGIDIQGGVEFLVELQPNIDADTGETTPVSRAALDQAVEIMRKRVDDLGVAEPVIVPVGDRRILIQMPAITEEQKSEIRQRLQRVGRLSLKKVHPESDAILKGLADGSRQFVPAGSVVLPEIRRDPRTGEDLPPGQIVVLTRTVVDGKEVASAAPSIGDAGQVVVRVTLTDSGAERFRKFSAENVGERLAIVMDDEVRSAPVIRSPLGKEFVIEGRFTLNEAAELASVLENPLENPVRIQHERNVDPTLGRSSVQSGFVAGMISLVLVVLFMLVYYQKAGVISVLILAFNLVILLGLLAQFHATLTLPGVAGIILTVGISVDACVLIFERMREELGVGKQLSAAVASGFDKAFSAIMDANVTTLIAAAILYFQGSGPVQSFAIVLCFGTLTSVFAALILGRTAFDFALARGWIKGLFMLSLVPSRTFDFMRFRKLSLAFSGCLVVGSLLIWLQKGEDAYGIDFLGGDQVVLAFKEHVPVNQVRSVLDDSKAVVQYQRDAGADEEYLTVRTAAGAGRAVFERLTSEFPQAEFTLVGLEQIDAAIGSEFRNQAIAAILLGMLGIFVYTAWRFEPAFAVGALVAVIHDVIVAVGIFVGLGYQLTLTSIAAILTVAGYSINDTIVVFDRIREGIRMGSLGASIEVVNECLSATLSRTVLTSLTTLIAAVALYLFGGFAVMDVALILILGIVVGTYSSIFVATAIVVMLNQRKQITVVSTVPPAKA